jgi:predicted small secreted protein
MRAVLVVLAALALTGCETVKGAGRDIQAGGRAIERAVDSLD